jgi:catechol 2,3-dioxygenase-like lactoylglutathione lyase family enzyme
MPVTTALALAQIGQIAIPVRDVARAIAFYRDTLGMRFLFDVPGRLAFFDCGGIRLMLGLPEGPDSERLASVIYYKVDDIAAAFDTLRARGVAFEREPHLIAELATHELWMAFFRDPDQNLLALMTEVPR